MNSLIVKGQSKLSELYPDASNLALFNITEKCFFFLNLYICPVTTVFRKINLNQFICSLNCLNFFSNFKHQ